MKKIFNTRNEVLYRVAERIFLYGPRCAFLFFCLLGIRTTIKDVLNDNTHMLLLDCMWLCFSGIMIFGLFRRLRAFYDFINMILLVFLPFVIASLWAGNSSRLGLMWHHVLFIIISGLYYFLCRKYSNILLPPHDFDR